MINDTLSIKSQEHPAANDIVFRSLSQQGGLSLIEMMIAMALSLFLIGILAQLAVANKEAYTFQQTQSSVQETSRYTGLYLDSIVSRAGFKVTPQNFETADFPFLAATSTCETFKPGQVVARSLTGKGICIRYQPAEANEADCTGNTPLPNKTFVTRIYFDSATESIMCATPNNDPVKLIGNIRDMQIEYGKSFDKDSQGRSAGAYVKTLTDWSNVVSIRFSVLAVSDERALDKPQSYYFPVSASTKTKAPDTKVYRSFEKTVALRNVIL